MDYNVDNYTIDELNAILSLEDPTEDEIIDTTNQYIEQYETKGDIQMSTFFQDVQTKLLQNANDTSDEQYTGNKEQTDMWIENQALPQSDSTQTDKTTDRKQKIDVYDNQQMPMKREQLGVNNNVNIPVAQDVLNPNLENITSRFINIDSQFRQAVGGLEAISTDYTLDLSDPLTNVLSLRLYSVQIPFTWYVIDTHYGNTCFWVVIPDPSNNEKHYVKVNFPPGNYTYDTFPVQFAKSMANAGITWIDPSIEPVNPLIIVGENNGKIVINLDGYVYTDPITSVQYPIIGLNPSSDVFDENINPYLMFFDFTGTFNCGLGCSPQNMTFNVTLGWVMGFRLPIVPVFSQSSGGNTAEAVLDLYGPKYFIIVIDDYNQNHINNGLISITELSNKLSLPSYYNTSQPYTCVPNTMSPLLQNNVVGNFARLTEQQAASRGINTTNISNSFQDKLDFGYGNREVVLPSAPRTLTQAQIYTINEIIKNREKTTSYRGKAPTTTDTFALVPIKKGNMKIGDLYAEFGGSMQDNKRIYFGPVNIDRMRVRLLDDKGFVVDLHGVDWTFTIISDNLYQY